MLQYVCVYVFYVLGAQYSVLINLYVIYIAKYLNRILDILCTREVNISFTVLVTFCYVLCR
jgi:hypothetical protein